jgi:hypothetical protein
MQPQSDLSLLVSKKEPTCRNSNSPLLALTTSLIASTGLVLAAATAKTADVTVVLVDGAWADASSWNKMIPLLLNPLDNAGSA